MAPSEAAEGPIRSTCFTRGSGTRLEGGSRFQPRTAIDEGPSLELDQWSNLPDTLPLPGGGRGRVVWSMPRDGVVRGTVVAVEPRVEVHPRRVGPAIVCCRVSLVDGQATLSSRLRAVGIRVCEVEGLVREQFEEEAVFPGVPGDELTVESCLAWLDERMSARGERLRAFASAGGAEELDLLPEHLAHLEADQAERVALADQAVEDLRRVRTDPTLGPAERRATERHLVSSLVAQGAILAATGVLGIVEAIHGHRNLDTLRTLRDAGASPETLIRLGRRDLRQLEQLLEMGRPATWSRRNVRHLAELDLDIRSQRRASRPATLSARQSPSGR